MTSEPTASLGQDTPAPAVPQYRQAYERTRAEIAAVPEAELVHINVDVMDLVTLGRRAARMALFLKSQAQAVLADFDVRHFDMLDTRALALGHAHAAYLAACKNKDEVPTLSKQARELRGTFREDIQRLIHRGLVPADALKGLSPTPGHQSAGFDLMTLTQVLRPRWDQLVGRTGISDAELTEAELLAERLLNLISSRRELRDAIRAATLTRAQAFKLFVDTYGQVRRAVLYLRYEEGDADEITPSPYRGRVKRPGKVGAAKGPSKDEPETAAARADEPAQVAQT